MMHELDLLDAELIGFDPKDLLKALPGVLKGTGEALQKSPAQPASPTPPPPPEPQGIGLGWKIGAGAAALGLLALLLKR